MSTGTTESSMRYNLRTYLQLEIMMFEMTALRSPPTEAIMTSVPFLSDYFPISRKIVALTMETISGKNKFKK